MEILYSALPKALVNTNQREVAKSNMPIADIILYNTVMNAGEQSTH